MFYTCTFSHTHMYIGDWEGTYFTKTTNEYTASRADQSESHCKHSMCCSQNHSHASVHRAARAPAARPHLPFQSSFVTTLGVDLAEGAVEAPRVRSGWLSAPGSSCSATPPPCRVISHDAHHFRSVSMYFMALVHLASCEAVR